MKSRGGADPTALCLLDCHMLALEGSLDASQMLISGGSLRSPAVTFPFTAAGARFFYAYHWDLPHERVLVGSRSRNGDDNEFERSPSISKVPLRAFCSSGRHAFPVTFSAR